MKKQPQIQITLLASIALMLILSGSTAAQTPSSCLFPGNTVVTDAENDALITQHDIQSVSVSEPISSDGSQQLVFTLKVRNLSPLPAASWNVIYKGADNVTRYAQMSTLLGNPQFTYGRLTNLLGLPVFNADGEVRGNFSSDGTIRFFVQKNTIGNSANGQILAVSARTYIRAAVDLVEADTTGENNYSLAGNAGCAPYAAFQWGTNGDVPVAADYTRDGVLDYAVWRPSTGIWYSNDGVSTTFKQFQHGSGTLGDIPLTGDFDTDGKSDYTVYRPSEGNWYIYGTANNTLQTIRFGTAEDIPAAADFDGDRIDDIAVFRPSIGTWIIRKSGDGSVQFTQFGTSEDRPTVGDYDGDRRADIAVFRPSNGSWYILRSSDGAAFAVRFGLGTDVTAQSDYDGDGKTDVAVWRPETGTWFVLRSGSSSFTSFGWGLSTDRVQTGDFNGNGRADYAIWRPNGGVWYVWYN